MKPPIYKLSEVSSLAWVIYSSPLMSSMSGIQFFGEEWCADQFGMHQDWLQQLDEDPTSLYNWIELEGQKLLGKRFESLVAFWFSHSPHFTLLYRNVLLMSNKNTSGEIDFIVYDKLRKETMHVEVACKYYIQVNASSKWTDWVGPNGHDSLQQKMDKLRQQVSIFRREEGKAFLKEHQLTHPSSYVLMKGHFFHHFSKLMGAVPPRDAHPHYNTGWYVKLNELDYFLETPKQWLILPKLHWTGPWTFAIEDYPFLDGQELITYCSSSFQRSPKALMLVQVQRAEDNIYMEISRGMVIK